MIKPVGIGLLLSLLSLVPLAAAERYRVGVEAIDYRPAYAGLAGRFSGAMRELLDAFAAAQGIEFSYQPLPVPRLYASFWQGHIDFKFPDNPNWRQAQRLDKTIHYSRPVLRYVDGTLVLAHQQPGRIDAIDTLGTVVGFTPWAWQQAIATEQVRLRQNADVAALMRQLLAGRVDAAYANVAVARYHLQQMPTPAKTVVFDPSLPYSKGSYHLATLNQPELLATFDQWLSDRAETVTALKRRHGLQAVAVDAPLPLTGE